MEALFKEQWYNRSQKKKKLRLLLLLILLFIKKKKEIIIIDRIGVVQQKHCDDFNLLYYLEKKK